MGLLTATPTTAGIAILNSELRQEVRSFVLIGHAQHEFEALDTLLAGDLMDITHEQIQSYIFFTRPLERAYFDDQGVLTFSLLVPHEDDLGKTIYALGLITTPEEGESPTLVSISKTPKIPKVANVGGHFTYKVAVRGEAAQVVFRNRNLVTAVELTEAITRLSNEARAYTDNQITPLQNSRASTTEHGLIRLATDAEMQAASDTQTAVVPAGLAAFKSTLTHSPLAPEILTADNRLSVTVTNNILVIADNQPIWTRQGLFNTTEKTLPQRTFAFNSTDTYHLYFDLERNQFELKDLADREYNPANSHHEAVYQAKKTDDPSKLGMGLLKTGYWIASIHKQKRSYFYQPSGSGSLNLPLGYGDVHVQINALLHNSATLNIRGYSGQNLGIFSTDVQPAIFRVSGNYWDFKNWDLSRIERNSSGFFTFFGIYVYGAINFQATSQRRNRDTNRTEFWEFYGHKSLTTAEQQQGLALAYQGYDQTLNSGLDMHVQIN